MRSGAGWSVNGCVGIMARRITRREEPPRGARERQRVPKKYLRGRPGRRSVTKLECRHVDLNAFVMPAVHGREILLSEPSTVGLLAGGQLITEGRMSTEYTLAYGTHATPDDGRCAMEWVSYLAGEPHSDQPACVSPVLRAFCTTLNDALDDDPRQRLRPYLTRTIGTADDGLDEARTWMALDWLVRTYTAAWLTVAKMPSSARQLECLPPTSTISRLR